MSTHIEIGRIAGIPINLDMFFVLILILFSYPYFTSGNTQLVATGLVIMAGLMLSILLHELGHAFAGRLFGVATREIELTGLGGVARFANALPRSVLKRTVIYLAGPAMNLLLWLGLGEVASNVQAPLVSLAAFVLAYANYFLLIFNLLPAYPLDGGHTLDAWLTPLLGPAWSVRIVACLGLLAAAGCAYLAMPRNFWMLFVALFLAQVNWQALQSTGGLKGGR